VIHLDISLPMLLFWCAVFFFAALGLALLCLSVVAPTFLRWLDYRCLARELQLAEYEAAIAGEPPSVESVESSLDSPTVHIGQIVPVPQQREPVDLPAASGPVKYGDAPLFDTLAMPLPPFEADFSFVFGPASWSTRTGEFPVIEAAVEPPPKARERFATTTAKRKGGKRTVSVDVRSEDMAVA
jgi:hypothetical protein